MCIIKFIKEKLQAYQRRKLDEEVYRWLEGWKSAWEWRAQQVAEEENWQQEEKRRFADYLEAQAEEQERTRLEILEERLAEAVTKKEHQILQEIQDDTIRERDRCPDCGRSVWDCHCHLNEQDEVAEITLIQKQCTESDKEEDEEMPQWLEDAHGLCPGCSLPRESCRCHEEE
ncbi:MAG: hypothetical protein WC250_03690 [Candidatus Paceibacterota bacterium]|jgi:hypothetical protein